MMNRHRGTKKTRLERSSGTLLLALTAWLTVVGIGAGGLESRAQEAAPAPLPAWKPQPGLARYLVRATRVGQYAMQPPAGYTPRQIQGSRLLAYTWRGPTVKTGLTPNVSLALGPTPLRGGKPYTAEQLVTAALTSLKRGHDDWTQTGAERGRINGLEFVRAYWTGTERQARRKLRGVTYMAVDGPTIISLQSQDIVPDAAKGAVGATANAPSAAETGADTPDAALASGTPDTVDRLKLAEAAMQTFRRYAAPKPVTPAAPVAP